MYTKEQRKKDREAVWNAIKHRTSITTRSATSLVNIGREPKLNAHYVSHRLKELEKEGKVEMPERRGRNTLWEVVK